MTDIKHTPGPWLALGTWPAEGWDGWNINAQTSPSPRGFSKQVADAHGSQEDPERAANAHLIAAAPDLYEALADHEHRLRHCSKNIEDEYPIWSGDLLKMADAARAILAKARGEAND